MGRDVNALYLLPQSEQLAKTEFYLLMAKVNVKATALVALVRRIVICFVEQVHAADKSISY